MTPVEILRGARALISSPGRWTKGAMARNASGTSTNPFVDAQSFCALGACRRVVGTRGETSGAIRYLDAAAGEHIDLFNDNPHTTHEDILAVFDKAISLAEVSS